jgi:hypothetical protein
MRRSITTTTAARPTAENLFRRYFRANIPGPESRQGKAGVFYGTGTRTRGSLPRATGRGSGASNRFLRLWGVVRFLNARLFYGQKAIR